MRNQNEYTDNLMDPNPSPSTPIDTIEWDYLLDSVRNHKCVLLLGPEIVPGLYLFKELRQWLESGGAGVSLSRDVAVHYERDELFLFTGPDARTRVSGRLGQFYQQFLHHFQPFYQKVAKLPFPVVISTIPDEGLRRIFEQEGVSSQFSYYHRKGTPKPHERIIAHPWEHRLIFNLFGKTGERDSLVLTHEDLFDYLKSILGAKPLSDDLYIHLSEALMEADDFIFLGFQFDHWYMQLLLRLLNPELSKGRQYAFNPELADETRIFFADQFKVDFISNLSPMEFLDKFCLLWEQYEQRYAEQAPLKHSLRDLMKQGQLLRILERLEEVFGEEGNLEQTQAVTLLQARFNDLRQQIRDGVLMGELSLIEMNRIRKSTLDLIDSLSD